jgi:hypothetical protein
MRMVNRQTLCVKSAMAAPNTKKQLIASGFKFVALGAAKAILHCRAKVGS